MAIRAEWPDRKGWKRLRKGWQRKGKAAKEIGHYEKCGSWWKFSVQQLNEGSYDRWQKQRVISRTDLRLVCQKSPDDGKAWLVKLQPHMGGKLTARADLVVMTDVLPWWGRNPYVMRLAGWYFLNTRRLTWDEYQSGYWEGSKWVYNWRVHHKRKGDAENIILKHLELVTVQKDKDYQKEEWPERYQSNIKFRLAKKPAAKGKLVASLKKTARASMCKKPAAVNTAL